MNLNDMKAKLQERVDLFKEVWPYLRHPYKIAQLKDSAQYWRDRLAENSVEALKDAYVQSLKDELAARKEAYDEAERLHEQDLDALIDDYEARIGAMANEAKALKAKLVRAYAENAKLWSERAAAIAKAEYLRSASAEGGDPYRVPPETTPDNL